MKPTTASPSRYPTASVIPVSPHTMLFYGTAEFFTVPANVTSITVTLYGGSGAEASNAHGRGGMISSVIPVTPGEALMVTVGSAGNVKAGGFNGGGDGSWLNGLAGGGATDIRRSPYTLVDRILIAGGGGGKGYGEEVGFGGDAGVEATK